MSLQNTKKHIFPAFLQKPVLHPPNTVQKTLKVSQSHHKSTQNEQFSPLSIRTAADACPSFVGARFFLQIML